MSPLLRPDWPAPAAVRAAVTLRHGAGVSTPPFDHFNLGLRCGDEPAAVHANRRALLGLAGLPAEPLWLRQVHGTAVHIGRSGGSRDRVSAGSRAASAVAPAVAADADCEPEADAAVTTDPGVVLAILTADCLPVLLCADDGREVAAAHAGWRGLCHGVLEATIAAMATPPSRLLAWLGPAAGPQAYEVGDEVRDAFLAHDAAAHAGFVPTRPGHWLCDLYALARQRLADAGVTRVHGGGLCTITDPARFFSHRRDRRTGRLASLIWLAG